METKWLKIDSAFPEYSSEQLGKLLKQGWVIKDKTVTGRYISYFLIKE
jgi:hypothetical protein